MKKYLTLLLISFGAHAATPEEIYQNSQLIECREGECYNHSTGEEFVGTSDQDGFSLIFTKEYSPEELRKASPYILRKLKEEGLPEEQK